jgi:hypothetical protein
MGFAHKGERRKLEERGWTREGSLSSAHWISLIWRIREDEE